MKAYLELMQHVLDHGTDKADRTGTGTRSVFGHQLRYDLNEENADNTDYAEKVARRELDYVKPGERVFYNVGGNN